jgi:hypothetical protein
MGGRRPSPAFQGTDGESTPVLDVFVPDQGDRQGMASVLVDSAEAHGLQRHIQSDAARRGFWISNDLADIVYDEPDETEAEPEPAPETPDKAPAKTGSTTKKKSVTKKGTNQ